MWRDKKKYNEKLFQKGANEMGFRKAENYHKFIDDTAKIGRKRCRTEVYRRGGIGK